MARPRTTFTDAQLGGILAAARSANDMAPARNDDFLDLFIAGVAESTGRIYGQPLYQRLLTVAEIHRRPSAQTWSKAINRAREATPHPSAMAATAPTQTALEALPAPAFPDPAPVVAISSDKDLVELKARAQVAETTSRDAYARIATLESERARLIERTTAAEASARCASQQLADERGQHEASAAALLARIEMLTSAVDRLTGLERHLHIQTDTLRRELGEQVQMYKSRVETLEKALAQERTQTETMRRVIGNRPGTGSHGTS
jgi:hypothetical protein